MEYLKPYQHLIEFVPFYFPTRNFTDGIQQSAYVDCIQRLKLRQNEFQWVAMADADEFFHLYRWNSIKDFVYNVTEKDSSIASFAFSSFTFYGEDLSPGALFINNWTRLTLKPLQQPKSIYSIGKVNYMNAHECNPCGGSVHKVDSKQEGRLVHYRYPMKQSTKDGILRAINSEDYSMKIRFSSIVSKNLFSVPSVVIV